MPLKLVMLPGMDGTGELFGPVLDVMPDAFDPVILPLPASATMTYAEHAEFIRDQLPVGEPYLLLAESFSSPIACHIADNPPKDLVGLILICGFWDAPRPLLSRLATEVSMRFLLKTAAREWVARRYLIGRDVGPRRLALLQRLLAELDPEVLKHRLHMISEPAPFRPVIHLPCIQVIARDDKLLPASKQITLDEIFPRLMSFKLHGPHLLLQAKPEFAVRLLEAEVERMGLDLD